MLKFTKGLMLAALGVMLSFASVAVADCCHDQNTCNGHNHPDKYIGVYYRSDVSTEDFRTSSLPIITLNEDGTAIVYLGESLLEFVTGGMNSPAYGNWQALPGGQVLVFVLGFFGQEVPPSIDIYSAQRLTFLLDFSQSLNSPTIIARSFVDLDGVPSSDWLNPTAGVVLSSGTIAPRQLQRICAFATDLTRPVSDTSK